ncbi:leucine-rich_repeat domain-containing protein [Hexamita inflata]|uniref:Leucine-rich_repeat domain-containing protein n=1 Tax=Hexamita inflata TaxID=28002 RepID=A0ABP1HFR6_9EUKA
MQNLINQRKLEQESKLQNELQKLIKKETLEISKNRELKNIAFMQNFKIRKLSIIQCENLIPSLNNYLILELSLNECEIKCIELINAPQLRVLSLRYNCIQDVKDIVKFPYLQELDLSGNKNVNFDSLAQLKQLTVLKLEYCQFHLFNDVKGLQHIQTLKELDLSGNWADDFAFISGLKQITKLTLRSVWLKHSKNVYPMRYLVNLEELDLHGNYGMDFTPIQYLTKLKKLNISYCTINNVVMLRTLENLQELDLSYNQVVHIYPLQDLKQLNQLNISSNCIQDMPIIQNHPKFKQYITNNQRQPTQYDTILANKIQDIDISNLLVYQLNKKLKNLKNTQYKQKALKSLKRLYDEQQLFGNKVVLLFEQGNRMVESIEYQ